MPIEPAPRLIKHDEFEVLLLTEGTAIGRAVGCDYVTIRPHAVTELHAHQASSTVIFVVSGGGFAEIDGVEHSITAGSRLHVPPGSPHGFRTTGSSLTFVSISAPPIVSPETGRPDVTVLISAAQRRSQLARERSRD